MEKFIDTASGLVGLGTAAGGGVTSLYKLIQSFRHHPKNVRDLMQGLEELQGVLQSLTNTAQSDIGINLSTLELPLQRCIDTCKEFEQEILKCSSQSGGDRTSFRDWAKLSYMGGDIDSFRRQLSGYQLTIGVALADANLRKSSLNAEELQGYRRLLEAATDDLQAHLQSMDEKLQIIFERTVAETDEDATELRRIKEEYITTEKGLEICAQLSDHINQIQTTAERNGHPSGFKNLQDCQHDISQAASKLEAHMRDAIRRMVAKSKIAMTSKDEVANLARIWDELETSFQCKEMFSEAESRLNENISVIENYGAGDARQVMATTGDKIIHGKNHGVGWRSLQVGGHMSEAALQDVVRSLSSLSDRRSADYRSPPDDKKLAGAGDVVVNGNTEKFRDQYGPGVRLSPTSTVNEASVKNPCPEL